MYKLFLTMRYLRKRRIAYFAIAAVALCVAMVLVVHSVMSGFLDSVRNNSRRLLGDVILELGGMESFPYYEEFIQLVKQDMKQDIVAATPVIINAGLMKIMGPLERDRTSLVMVNGIQLEEYRRINSFGEGLFYDMYYPGLTRFDDAAMPLFRWDENGIPRLPDAFEEALARYRRAHDDPDFDERYRRRPLSPFGGPGYFRRANEALPDSPAQTPEYTGMPLPGIIAGVELVARRLEDGSYERDFPRGALVKLTVLSLTRSGDPSADPASTAALRLVDDSRTKIYEIDKNSVYVDFNWLQRLLGMEPQEYVDGSGLSPARATQILIKLADEVDCDAAADHIRNMWMAFAEQYAPRCEDRDRFLMKYMMVMTWEQRNASFIMAVEKERILVVILFAIISLVAVLLVGCIFYMIVQEKTREVGIVRSMGATSWGIATVFMIYGLWIGIVGSTIGTTLGAVFVYRINEFQDFLARFSPKLRVWNPEFYSFDRIPSTVNPRDAAVIIVIAILASVLGSLIAARKAARIWPVDAIRFE